MSKLEIKPAVRRAAPLLLAICGPEGSGKTLSALLLAAGLDPEGRIVLIDTEAPKASLHADNERVMAALPDGFEVVEVDQPYHPRRLIEAIDLCENAGYNVCLIDSLSDFWNGAGGCEDITEQNGGMWNKAKKENKRMMTRIKQSKMHVIACVKAQDKTKILEGPPNARTGKKKKEFVNLGMQPVCEKNTMYPMLIRWMVDADTHIATMKKYSVEALAPLFIEPRLLSKKDGVQLREWNETGVALGEHDQIAKRAKSAAADGVAAYKAFYTALSNAQKKALRDSGAHEENKYDAEQADNERDSAGKDEGEDI